MKRTYLAPSLVSYGTVSTLTRGGSVFNQDVPFGVAPNSAYPTPVVS